MVNRRAIEYEGAAMLALRDTFQTSNGRRRKVHCQNGKASASRKLGDSVKTRLLRFRHERLHDGVRGKRKASPGNGAVHTKKEVGTGLAAKIPKQAGL